MRRAPRRQVSFSPAKSLRSQGPFAGDSTSTAGGRGPRRPEQHRDVSELPKVEALPAEESLKIPGNEDEPTIAAPYLSRNAQWSAGKDSRRVPLAAATSVGGTASALSIGNRAKVASRRAQESSVIVDLCAGAFGTSRQREQPRSDSHRAFTNVTIRQVKGPQEIEDSLRNDEAIVIREADVVHACTSLDLQPVEGREHPVRIQLFEGV